MEKAGAGALFSVYSGPDSGGVCGSSAVVFTGGSDRFADLAFLEFDAPVVVAVGGPEHDSSAWPRQLGALLYGLHQMQMRNKKRRRELGSLIKRFRSGAESLPDAVVLTTEEGAIFWCNGLAQQILNLRWPDDSGQNILNLLRYPEFANYLKQRDFSKPLNLVLNNARHLEIRVMPYSDKQWLMVARDVTQMHQLEGARRNFFRQRQP